MTSRIKIEPNTKALFSSMVSKESIDSNLKKIFTMKKITLDFEFISENVSDRGFSLIDAATRENPDLLKDILRTGWGQSTCLENPFIGRKFLENLVKMKSPEDAKEALCLYFKDASKETINNQVILVSEKSNEYSPLVFWLNRSKYTDIYPSAKELIKQAKNLGADFDHVFKYSMYDDSSSKYKSANHTILSVTLQPEKSGSSYDSNHGKIIPGTGLDRALFLIGLGKSFDESTASHLTRMEPHRGLAWAKFFIDQKKTTATEILKMTSKNKLFNSEIKATLSSMSAMEAINAISAINETMSTKPGSSAAR